MVDETPDNVVDYLMIFVFFSVLITGIILNFKVQNYGYFIGDISVFL